MSKLKVSRETYGIWKALDDNCYQWQNYKMYRSIHGWTVWAWGDHSRRVGNSALMSKAMELARSDHELQSR